jgi:hypothetical protein
MLVVSLNEGMASRLFQWARDMRITDRQGSWKAQPHEVKEQWRNLANRLHNYLGSSSYPEGQFTVVPEGYYKVRPYVREYGSTQGEVGPTDGQAESEHAAAALPTGHDPELGGDQGLATRGSRRRPPSSRPKRALHPLRDVVEGIRRRLDPSYDQACALKGRGEYPELNVEQLAYRLRRDSL